MPTGVVLHIRHRLRWDVLSVVEDHALRRASDVEHYRIPCKIRRILISLDGDFLDERKFPPADSGSVIILSAPDQAGLIRFLDKVNRLFFTLRGRRPRRPVATPLAGRKIQVHPDWSHPSLQAPRRRRRTRKKMKAPGG